MLCRVTKHTNMQSTNRIKLRQALPIQTPPSPLGRESALSTAPGDWDCLLASGTIMQ